MTIQDGRPKYIEKQSPIRYLSLEQLSQKLITLLALVTGQRLQTIHAFNLSDLTIENNRFVFNIQELLKHSKPSNKVPNNIVIHAFSSNKRICPVFHLKHYIKRTVNIRKDEKLFLNHQKPHGPITKATLSRWLKKTLNKAGIDTVKYTSHSTRAASTSAAAKASLDITTIMKAASWSNAGTFKRFYNKEITNLHLVTPFYKIFK